MGLIEYLERELRRLRVDVQLGFNATRDLILSAGPDLVILATGSCPNFEELPKPISERVITTWELMDETKRILSGRALVVDDGSGAWQVCGAAEFLASRGLQVDFITPASAIGMHIPPESVGPLHARLRANGVVYSPFTRLVSVNERRRC